MNMKTKILIKPKEHLSQQLKYMDVEEKCKTTSHVLNVSANLMGICFILLTSIKLLGKAEATIVDEICGVAIVLFMTSCIFFFIAAHFRQKKIMA